MRILVLGGTEFVGRAVVEAALARGDEVTVLNRGSHPVPGGAHRLTADRRVPEALANALGRAGAFPSADGYRFDLVIDTWSWEPWVVRDGARVLEPLAERYAYVSSRSVYADPVRPGSDETAPVVEASADDGDPRLPGATPTGTLPYARLKAGAERAVEQAFGERGLLVRPGLILGPWENIGRLPWWLTRMARGGEVPAPGEAGSGIQCIDVRDLAWWILGLPTAVPVAQAAAGRAQAFDAVSPVGMHTMGELLDSCVAVTGSAARLRWVPEQTLLGAGVAPWTELPVWLPAGPDHEALHESDVSKALTAGLVFRPLAETVADTWAWLGELGGVVPLRGDRAPVGLTPEAEQRVLAAAGASGGVV